MTDPLGKDQHELGAKLDAGKNRLGMVLMQFRAALEAAGEVGTLGAAKYTDEGWKHVPNGKERYLDAMFRHLFSYYNGEENDPESGKSHMGHFAWNALAVASLHLNGDEEDELAPNQECCSPVLPNPGIFPDGISQFCPCCQIRRNASAFEADWSMCNFCRKQQS
jgi:hypothetical protein